MTSDPASGGEGGFLSRWSRRKQANTRTAAPEAPPAEAPDLSLPELPPIEELGAGSDYRAFLQKGVAAAVQAQALHKAWTSDAAIAGFRGMADYDWDFNATGYGRLWAADNVPKLLEAVLGPANSMPGEAPAAEAPPAEPNPPSVRQSAPEPVVASLPEPEPEQPSEPPQPRRHGSATPV